MPRFAKDVLAVRGLRRRVVAGFDRSFFGCLFVTQHLTIDLAVPALNDMTPREAAKTEEGRDLLESLLLLYEHHENSADNVFSSDVSALRQELGMD